MMPRLPVLGLLCALAAGCSSTPASRFYVLNATASGSAAPAATSSLSVAVGPVSVPASVDRAQFVASTGPNQVELDEFQRWASPLQNNIARVVVENLAILLAAPRVTQYPQALGPDADYRVAVEVQRFESTPGKSIVLDAVWAVRRSKDGKFESGRTTMHEDVEAEGFAVLAAAHSRALGRLSQDIADAVRAMDRAAR